MLTVRFDVFAPRAGEKVLDLGCGTGRHSFETAARGADVIAADVDAGVLKEVRDVAAALEVEPHGNERRLGAVSCVASDALALPFPDRAFDKVIVSEVLEHVQRDADALAEVARVLRPGGLIAISVPRAWPERICWRLSTPYHSKEGGHVRIYERRDLLAKVSAAGFRVLETHHAHALHAPYWWLRCAVGVDDTENPFVRAYHRFLVWDIERQPRAIRMIEQSLDPILGKSLVLYARKDGER